MSKNIRFKWGEKRGEINREASQSSVKRSKKSGYRDFHQVFYKLMLHFRFSRLMACKVKNLGHFTIHDID